MVKIEVGNIIKTAEFGDIKVLEVLDRRKVLVVFIDTGIERVAARNIARLRVLTPEIFIKKLPNKEYFESARIAPGTVLPSNYWGDMEVIEYKSSKHIEIAFINTGNKYITTRDSATKGLLQDSVERKRLAEEAKKQIKQEKLRTQQERTELLLKEIAQQEARSFAAKLARKEEKDRYISDNKNLDSSGNLFVNLKFLDKFGKEFVVASRVIYYDRLTSYWEVLYENTGNVYQHTEEQIMSWKVADKLSPDYEKDEKEYKRKKAAMMYEENRDAIIARASQYQRDNPEKTRLRNAKRRLLFTKDNTITKPQMKQLMSYQNSQCACCSSPIGIKPRDHHLDHIIPLALGGENVISNIQYLCQFCSNMKADKHPEEWIAYTQTEEFVSRRDNRNRA